MIVVKMPTRAAIRAYAPVSPPNSMLDGLGNIASIAVHDLRGPVMSYPICRRRRR